MSPLPHTALGLGVRVPARKLPCCWGRGWRVEDRLRAGRWGVGDRTLPPHLWNSHTSQGAWERSILSAPPHTHTPWGLPVSFPAGQVLSQRGLAE